MRAIRFLPLLILAAGCKKDDVDDTGDTGDTEACQLGEFDCYINSEVTPTGDLACFTAGGSWLAQNVDTTLQVSEERTELIHDFEDETAVYDSTAQFWFDDVVSGAADLTVDADESGEITFTSTSCTPMSYLVTTPAELDETKDTYESHQIYGPVAAADPDPLYSVSKTTYQVIPNLMGISVDPTKSIIAGEVRDCDGQPVQGAEVVVVNDQGTIPDTLVVKYFVDSFPNRDQPETSADGLWVAINVPPGVWTVEAYLWDGTEHVLVGKTQLTTFSDSINISSIYYGFETGVWYPESCLLTSR